MAFALKARRPLLGLAAMLASAVLIWFGTGLDPFWPLMWFAPLPVLLFALDATAWGAAFVGGLAMILGLLNLWSFLHSSLHVPLPVLVGAYLTQGVMLALAILLFRALMKRRAYLSALLAFAAYWVSFEWCLNVTSVNGTGGSLAYSQLGFLPFLQLASITGPWGMTFVLLAFPAALAIAIGLRTDAPKVGYRILGATVVVIAAVLLYGTVRLQIPTPGAPVKVALVTSDGANEEVAGEGAPAARLFQAYAAPLARLAREGAAVVVLPEKAAVVIAPGTTVDTQLQSLAEQAHVRLVVGVLRVVPASAGNPAKVKYNEARVYTPGAPVESYDKEHMLPPFEADLTPGTALTLLRARGSESLWGVAICKDMDFTRLSRRYGEAGVGLMLVPAWDFFLDWIQHGHIAVMRGVESGFSVVRSAKGGSLFVSDDRGRILGETKSNAAPFSVLLASVPQTHDETLFLRLGDWFAWVALALLLLSLANLVRLVRQP
jgi:apolipoprotein N-acyltransferase